jgi:DNA-binding SARP family transcriptional activator
LDVRLLGPFSVSLGQVEAGPWARPSAKRLAELVLVSPGLRTGREAACEALFPNPGAASAANALRRALSMAKAALSPLGEGAAGLLSADRGRIFANAALPVEVDSELQAGELRKALATAPGPGRDELLCLALAAEGTLLEDEPYADWAIRPREALETLRQEARLALARDRTRGAGRCCPEAVVEAWEACLSHDPASEEAAAAVMRAHAAQGCRHLVVRAYERCRAALEDLGLRASPALEELYAEAAFEPAPAGSPCRAPPGRLREERKVAGAGAPGEVTVHGGAGHASPLAS